jgi:trigger factor
VLGSKGMIPGFEEGLVGANVNDSVELNLEFPKEYPQKDLAGKPVKFIVKIIKIMEPRLPALDDAFAEKLDVKGGIEVLRAEVQKSMQRELERNIKEEVKRQVLQHLIKHNPIDVPNALINAEIDQMQQQLKQRFAMQAGKDMKFPDLPREQFFEQAKERVIIGLLLAEFVKIQQIKADHSRVRAIIAEIASSYDNPEQIINYYFQNKSSLAQIETLVLEEQAIEKLLEAAQVEEKIVTYDEVVR